MAMLRQTTVAQHVNTIWAIAASRFCKSFVIGYTATARRERHRSHKALGWQHMVLLEDGMTVDQALDLEKRLQDACKKDERVGSAYRKKYASSQRKDSYRRSVGSGSPDPDAPNHLVYMLWWEE